jgi:hypothetical protein
MKKQNSPVNLFVELFAAIELKLSFNRNWHAAAGRITGVISHTDYRIILDHGQKAKMIDNLGRRVIMLGTHYGMVVFYEANPRMRAAADKQKILFEVCPMLVEKEIFTQEAGITGIITLQHAFDTTYLGLLEQVERRAEIDRAAGTKVWDGIPLPEVKKKPRHQRHAERVQKNVDSAMKDGAPVGKWLAEGKKKHKPKGNPQKKAREVIAEVEARRDDSPAHDERFALSNHEPEPMVPEELPILAPTGIKHDCGHCADRQCEADDTSVKIGGNATGLALLGLEPTLPEGIRESEVLGSGSIVLGIDPGSSEGDAVALAHVGEDGEIQAISFYPQDAEKPGISKSLAASNPADVI